MSNASVQKFVLLNYLCIMYVCKYDFIYLLMTTEKSALSSHFK